jgi:polyhydroxyalkanoate synthesis regulator phasin
MKKAILAVLFAVMMFGAVAISYAADDWHGGIRSRVEHAKDRIERGVQDGSLTKHEAKKLHKELDGIIDEINRDKADGHLDHREKERINHDLDRLEKDISREKHNDEKRR